MDAFVSWPSVFWNFFFFLPFFFGLFLLGALKGFLVLPFSISVLSIANTAVLLGLWPAHVVCTYYGVARTKRLGPVLRVVLLLILPAPFILVLVFGVAGSVLVGIGYGFFTPLVATFEAVREGRENKFFHCFVDGVWDTIKGSCTVVRDFTDFCFHSYFSYLDDYLKEPPPNFERFEIKVLDLPGCVVVGLLGVLLDVPLITCVAIYKSPYMLLRGWRRLLQDLIGREGPFLETVCVPVAGLAVLLWPLVVVIAVLCAVLSSTFIGLYGAVVVYQVQIQPCFGAEFRLFFSQKDARIIGNSAQLIAEGNYQRKCQVLGNFVRINFGAVMLPKFSQTGVMLLDTGKVPFEIVAGVAKVPPFLSMKDKIFEADEYTRDLDTAFVKVHETLQKSQERQKKAVDRHRRDLKLKEDDWVLLRFEKARPRKKKGKERLFPKLSMRYYGPFQIVEKINNLSFRLKLPDTWRIHNAFHVSLLKPFKGDVPDTGEPDEQPEVEENEEILVSEQILAHKDTKNKGKVRRRFLVKFKNYPALDAKWMEEEDVADTPQIVNLYLEAIGLA
ncbi:hypothetical protein L7F22_016006 [Adiantum nelumboides]|nr:hypothetical protein [Adiantum nelumboides]